MAIQQPECHLCSSKMNSSSSKSFAKCCKKKCGKAFCKNCIIKLIQKDFLIENVRADTWICYFCVRACPCMSCEKKNSPFSSRNPSRSFLGSLRSRTWRKQENDKNNNECSEKKEGNVTESEKSEKSGYQGTSDVQVPRLQEITTSTALKKVPSFNLNGSKSRRSVERNGNKGIGRDLDTTSMTLRLFKKSERKGETTSNQNQAFQRALRANSDSVIFYNSDIIDNMKRSKKRIPIMNTVDEKNSKMPPLLVPIDSEPETTIPGNILATDTLPPKTFEMCISLCKVNKLGDSDQISNKNKRRADKRQVSKYENRYLAKKKLLKIGISIKAQIAHQTGQENINPFKIIKI